LDIKTVGTQQGTGVAQACAHPLALHTWYMKLSSPNCSSFI